MTVKKDSLQTTSDTTHSHYFFWLANKLCCKEDNFKNRSFPAAFSFWLLWLVKRVLLVKLLVKRVLIGLGQNNAGGIKTTRTPGPQKIP